MDSITITMPQCSNCAIPVERIEFNGLTGACAALTCQNAKCHQKYFSVSADYNPSILGCILAGCENEITHECLSHLHKNTEKYKFCSEHATIHTQLYRNNPSPESHNTQSITAESTNSELADNIMPICSQCRSPVDKITLGSNPIINNRIYGNLVCTNPDCKKTFSLVKDKKHYSSIFGCVFTGCGNHIEYACLSKSHKRKDAYQFCSEHAKKHTQLYVNNRHAETHVPVQIQSYAAVEVDTSNMPSSLSFMLN